MDTREGPPFKIVETDLIASQQEASGVSPSFDAFLELVGYEDPEISAENIRLWGEDWRPG